jgi:ribulose bisphosphate carboxylase small subunit
MVDTFPDQAIDFFGAVRSQIYNEQVRDFIFRVGIENVLEHVDQRRFQTNAWESCAPFKARTPTKLLSPWSSAWCSTPTSTCG